MYRSREPGAAGGVKEAAAGPPEPPRRDPRGADTPHEPPGCRFSGLVNWRRRPCWSCALFAAANAVFWFVTFSALRTFSVLAVLLLPLVILVTIRDVAKSRPAGAHLWQRLIASWEIIDSGQDAVGHSGPQFSDSLRLFLQEMSAFKQQNPGKFCLLVCSICTFFAVLGRYIPGVVISYILVLAVFLWPLISSHDASVWLEPVLQKLDFGVIRTLNKIRENHKRRVVQARAEKEAIESDLSSMFPKLDSAACREMSVSDTEVSDLTWTDNGTFNLSEGHTPQTDNSDDLDREEAFASGMPDFPSLDNAATTNGDDDELSLGLPSATPSSHGPIKLGHTLHSHRDQQTNTNLALELVNQMAGDVIASAVTAAIQERIEAAVGVAQLPGCTGPLKLAEESDSEVEDFELLDQSELENLEGELGLDVKEATPTHEAQPPDEKASPSGFFSKLLRRQ